MNVWWRGSRGLLAFVLVASGCGQTTSTPDTMAARVALPPCPEAQVCVRIGGTSAFACLWDDGTLPRRSGSCTPQMSCADGQQCLILGQTESGCFQACVPQDERPACSPGCYNQACADRFGMCSRDAGACQPAACRSDIDCQALLTCDFPQTETRGFRCNREAGFCERIQ